jgi:acid phosphatase type 7
MSRGVVRLGIIAVVAVGAIVPTGLWRFVTAGPCEPPASCPSPSASPDLAGDPIVVAAGSISGLRPSSATRATAKLVTAIDPNVVIALGDNQYPDGTRRQYDRGYEATWGAFVGRTHPTAGDRDYGQSATASGYFSYFGSRSPGRYYSYDVGAWHIISLDSNCAYVEGCGRDTPEYEWLRADLAENPAICTLAYWHHPRWTSGLEHGNASSVAPLWDLLYGAGADVVLSGHERNYERFAPQDPRGHLDATNGIVEFVAGTGGSGLDPLGPADPNSIVSDDATYGVLQLTLHTSSYDFVFKGVPGSSFSDTGTGFCH